MLQPPAGGTLHAATAGRRDGPAYWGLQSRRAFRGGFQIKGSVNKSGTPPSTEIPRLIE